MLYFAEYKWNLIKYKSYNLHVLKNKKNNNK